MIQLDFSMFRSTGSEDSSSASRTMARLAERVDGVEGRLEGLQADMTSRFDRLEQVLLGQAAAKGE